MKSLNNFSKTIAITSVIVLALFLSPPVFAEDKISDLFEASFGHEVQGNYKAALNNIIKLLRQDRKNYTATLRAGWLYYSLGKYDQSIEYYQKAIELKAHAIEPVLGITLPYMAKSQWVDAENYARKVLKKAPANYYANSRIAWILYSQGRYSDALVYYKKVHDWYPSDLEMILGLGYTYLKIGKKEDARKYFQAVLQIRQNNLRALHGLNALSN